MPAERRWSEVTTAGWRTALHLQARPADKTWVEHSDVGQHSAGSTAGSGAVLASSAVALAGAGLHVASGLPLPAASGWLCLPVTVVLLHSPSRLRAALAALGGTVVATGAWAVAGRPGSPAAVVLSGGLLLALALLVAGRARQVHEGHRRDVRALEERWARAVLAADERDALSSRLAHQALHDALTGLPNRSMFLERMREALRRGRDGDGHTLGVLFLDLDDFKTVNDSLGHASGDELLVGVSRRLENALRPGDLVARFGGDEFAVLLLDGGTAEQVTGVANRLIGVLHAPFVLAAGMASGQGSGGLVLDERDGERAVEEQAGDLMRQADLAMYAAKAAGGGRCVTFHRDMQAAMVERLTLQDEITKALIAEQFCLEYQPVVDLQTGDLVAVEALLRWRHPERGVIPPSRFIPVAERSGAIVPLGLWVLEEACLDLRLWDDVCPGSNLRISVNVSARQLREASIGPQIARILHRTGVDPRRLLLEITESMIMEDSEVGTATLWQLRALGIRIAVDDFGTGYSSLSRLVDLPLDDLKIDRSFVGELERSGAGATIVKAAIAMAHGLDLKVVAEGVETREQLHFLADAGCDHAQGYLFSPPVPPDAVIGMLRRGVGALSDVRDRLPGPRAGLVEHLPSRPTPTVIPSLPRHR